MNNRLLILIFFMMTLSSIAQDYTLEDCINYAMDKNLSLSNQKINAEISEENYLQSKRNLLPVIEAGASGNQYFGRSIDPTTNDFVNQRLFSSNFYLSTQVSLFNGFIKQNTIKFNKLQHLLSEEQVKQKEIELTYTIMTAFYDAIYYEQLLKVVDEQLSLTKINIDKTNKLIDLGLKAESDLLEILAQESSEKHQLLTIKNQFDNSILLLKRAMNFPINDNLSLHHEQNINSIYQWSVQEIYEHAVNHMPQLQITKLSIKSSENEINIAQGRFYPTLYLGGNYTSGFADSNKENTNISNPNNPIWETIAFNRQFKQNASQSVYLSLSIPIFYQWQSRSKLKIAKLNLENSKNLQEEMARELYQQIAEDHQQLQALIKEQEHLKIVEESQEKVYEIAEKKLNQGLISVLEFYTAKNQLTNTKAELLRVQTQLKIKGRTMKIYLNDTME